MLDWGIPLVGLLLLPLLMGAEEDWGLWILFEWRGTIHAPDEVVVVGIDQTTEQALGRPVPRDAHADVVDTLIRRGASVIVFDVFLHTASEHDGAFARAIEAAGNVVLTARLERDDFRGMDAQVLQAPVAELGAPALGTAPSLVPEVFRVNWVFLKDDADRRTTPLVTLQAYAFDDFMSLLHTVRPEIGARLPRAKPQLRGQPLERVMDAIDREFATDRSLAADMLRRDESEAPGVRALIGMYRRDAVYRENRLYLNYYGPPRTMVTVSYQDVLAHPSADEAPFTGKAVFVGYSGRRQPEQRDDYAYVYSTKGFNLSGVEMGATAFANLLHGTSLRLPALPVRAALVVSWGLLIAACFRRLRVRAGMAVGVSLLAAYLAAAFLAFRLGNLWLPIVVPTVQFLFAATLSVRVKQLAERAQLGIGTSEEAVLALTGRGKPEKTDYRVILFADEQGSKKRLRRALAELDIGQRRALQRDLALARDVAVTGNGGRINHTLADSILAYWVTSESKDAAHVASQSNAACRAALAIHARVGELNRMHPGFDLSFRVGLDWGEISSQLNPSSEIKDWRMEGAPIHAAERLESLNKMFGTSTLVSHSVASRLDTDEFHCPELGTFVFCDDGGDIVVDPLRACELRPAELATEDEVEFADGFEQALDTLRRRDWQAACMRFENLAATGRKHSRLALLYVDWCRQTLHETNSRWTGVIMVRFSDKSQYLDRFL